MVRRDTREKIVCSLDGLDEKVPELLDDIQASLYKKALDPARRHDLRLHGA